MHYLWAIGKFRLHGVREQLSPVNIGVGQKVIITCARIYFRCGCCRPEITMVITLILNSVLLHFCNTLLAKTVQKMREPA